MISITKNIEKNEPKKSSLPKLLFRKDVMEYFGISKSTLHRWVNVEGKLKSFKDWEKVSLVFPSPISSVISHPTH